MKAISRQAKGAVLAIVVLLALGTLAAFFSALPFDIGSSISSRGSVNALASESATGDDAEGSDESPSSSSLKAFSGETRVGTVWRLLSEGCSLGDAMLEVGMSSIEAQAELPTWLVDEVVGSIDGKEGVFANEDFSLIGFTQDGERDEVVGRLLSELSEKGWVPYGDSCADVVSLMKREGDCRWLMLECIALEGEASVVLHIARG